MEIVNIHAAKTHFSRFVEAAEAGQETIISRAGKPVAKLVPLHAPGTTPRRVLGGMAGRLRVPPGFDAPLPDDVLGAFERR